MDHGTTQLSLGELRAGVGRWFKANARRAIITAVVGFAVGWVINVWVMAIRYDGYRAGPSALATSDGNVVNGGLFFGILSMLVVGVASYGFGVGWSTFRSEVSAVPGTIARVVRESGGRAWSLILWSAALLMLVSGVVAPGVSAVLGLGLLAMAPSALSQILGRFFVRLWVEVAALVAPAKRPTVSGLGASLIGLTGGGAGLLLASQVDTTSVRVVLAAMMIGGAYLIVARPGMSAGVVVIFGGFGLIWLLTGALPAFADDGGWLEFQFSNPNATWWDWFTHEDTQRVLVLGVGGGIATGVGSAAGAAIGSVLSTIGAPSLGGATWNDPNAPSTATPPTTTTTIILEGDDARAALDAWKGRDPNTSPVIDIPEEEQWRVWASSGDGTNIVRQGHRGTRGVLTGVGAVATGDDGSIVIVVDVEGFVPSGTTPPAEISLYPESGGAEPASAGSTPDGGDGPSDETARSAEPAAAPESDGRTEADERPAGEGELGAGETGSSEPELESIPESETVEPPRTTPPAGDGEPEPAEEAEPAPEASDADSAAEWARNTLTGKVPPGTVDDIGEFLTDPERSEVTVAPRIEGIYGSIVGQPQNTESGVRIPLKGIGHVDLEVEDGQLKVEATPGALGRTVDLLSSIFSSEDSKLPSFDDVNRGAASSSARVNAAMRATGRTFAGVEALPDGSIRLTTSPP